MATKKLLLLPGDGIGVETMAEVERLIAFFNSRKNGVKFETEADLVGGAAYDAHGVAVTDDCVAKAKAAEVAGKVKGASDFDKAAKAAGVEPKTTDLITRDGQIPDLGIAPNVLATAFTLPAGAVSDAIPTANGVAVVKVLEKTETTDSDFSSLKDSFRSEILADRRNQFFGAYMGKAKQKMKISVDREALNRTMGL